MQNYWGLWCRSTGCVGVTTDQAPASQEWLGATTTAPQPLPQETQQYEETQDQIWQILLIRCYALLKIPAIQVHSRITNLCQFNYCKLHLLIEAMNKPEKQKILHRNKCIYKTLWSVNLEGQILSFACVNTRQQRALPFVSWLQDFLPDSLWGWCKQYKHAIPFTRKGKKNPNLCTTQRKHLIWWFIFK